MFIEEMTNPLHYMTRWVSDKKSHVHAHRMVYSTLRPGMERQEIGVVFIGSAEDCRKYIGRKIGGLQLSCNKLYNSKGA